MKEVDAAIDRLFADLRAYFQALGTDDTARILPAPAMAKPLPVPEESAAAEAEVPDIAAPPLVSAEPPAAPMASPEPVAGADMPTVRSRPARPTRATARSRKPAQRRSG